MSRPGSRRSWTAFVAGVVVAAAVSGCSPADAASGPALPHLTDLTALVGVVADRQRIDQTAKLSLRGEITGGASTLQFTGEGVLRVFGDTVSVKFTQVVTQRGADPQETGFVVLPDAVYLRRPSRQGSTRPWTKVDRTSTDPDARQLVAQSETLTDSADPARTLSRYADATTIADADDDVIDGDPAVRYTIVIDLAKAAAQQPDPATKAQLEQQVRAGLTQLRTTLWVDDAGRPVRSAVRQELPGIGTLAITGSYRDWGQPVDIDAPPTAQVR